MHLVKELEHIHQETLAELDEHPVAGALFDGTIEQDDYEHFLVQTYHYVGYSKPFLAAAADGMRQRSPELGMLLATKSEEEEGHELLALRDLEALGVDPANVVATSPCVPILEYIAYHHREISGGDPYAILGAAFLFESLAVSRGGIACRNLSESPNPRIRKAMRFISVHAEADQSHLPVLIGALRRIHHPPNQASIIASARMTGRRYARSFDRAA